MESASRPRVCLFGEAVVHHVGARRIPGGAPLLVACHLRALGAEPLLLTRVGNDADGRLLVSFLRDHGLSTLGVQVDSQRPTGRVVVASTGERRRLLFLPGQACDRIEAAEAHLAAAAWSPDLLYFGTLAQRGLASRAALARCLGLAGVRRMADLNLRSPWYSVPIVERSLRAAQFLKLSERELGVLAALLGLGRGSPEEWARRLCVRYGIRGTIVTSGARGSWILGAGRGRPGPTRVPAGPAPGPLLDTSGAGEAFAAAAILGIIGGWADSQILSRAGALARALCTIPGTLPPTRDFYSRFREWSPPVAA